jgi:hypothetical protein
MFRPIAGVEVVGLVGHGRHGKDSLAKFLMRLVPGAERFAFSDAIAAYARALGAMSARDPKLMQVIGWDRRQANPDVWLQALYGAIADRAPSLAIVTGVRFRDEAQMIREMGGRIVRVVRLEPDGQPFRDPGRAWDHPTEREIPLIPHDVEIVAQSGDMGRLEALAGSLL